MKPETTTPQLAATAPGLSQVGQLVRQHDPDRYATALFAAPAAREALFALYAFNYEVARVREAVTQPMLGQIRLQWWREVIETAYEGGEVRPHEVAQPLTATIREYRPNRGLFDRIIDSRERDLEDEPPATMTALEDYAEGTSAALVHLALELLGGDTEPAREAAREVGIAYALVGLLRAMPFHARAGRRYIPQDVAESTGQAARDYAELRDTPALRAAVEQLAQAARGHLRAARAHAIPRSAWAALLPGVIARRSLVRLQRTGYNPFDPTLALPDPLLVWRLAGAKLLGTLRLSFRGAASERTRNP